LHIQVYGFEPETTEATPAEQRPEAGGVEKLLVLAVPHSPLIPHAGIVQLWGDNGQAVPAPEAGVETAKV
jgi:hypothetical protein